jgi:hypothetical protein
VDVVGVMEVGGSGSAARSSSTEMGLPSMQLLTCADLEVSDRNKRLTLHIGHDSAAPLLNPESKPSEKASKSVRVVARRCVGPPRSGAIV